MADLDQLVGGRHADPHSVLGAHARNGGVVVRAYRPKAERVSVLVGGERVLAEQVHPDGVFEAELKGADLPLDYELEVAYADGNTFTLRDPYAFLPTLGELDVHLAGEGRHEELYAKLGAHVLEHGGATGTAFAVWAPAAASVSVVGDFNSWDGRLHPMRSLGSSGIWELFVPGVAEGQRYKFEIRTPEGELRLKADPYAQAAEHPPLTASVVHRSQHEWGDTEWMTRRAAADQLGQPMSIYEVHLGSWRKTLENESLSYLDLADQLTAYVKDMNFTHVELLPVMAHPFDGSWGYQVTSHFAPTPRYGSPDELKQFIDRLHAERDRRDPRLGPGALPQGRLGAGALRRHRAVRARRPAPRRAPGVGDARVQLRPQRGPQLPRLVRPVLARRVPRRRAARRCRRVDALPRLLA